MMKTELQRKTTRTIRVGDEVSVHFPHYQKGDPQRKHRGTVVKVTQRDGTYVNPLIEFDAPSIGKGVNLMCDASFITTFHHCAHGRQDYARNIYAGNYPKPAWRDQKHPGILVGYSLLNLIEQCIATAPTPVTRPINLERATKLFEKQACPGLLSRPKNGDCKP